MLWFYLDITTQAWLDSDVDMLSSCLDRVTRCVECTFATSSPMPGWEDAVFVVLSGSRNETRGVYVCNVRPNARLGGRGVQEVSNRICDATTMGKLLWRRGERECSMSLVAISEVMSQSPPNLAARCLLCRRAQFLAETVPHSWPSRALGGGIRRVLSTSEWWILYFPRKNRRHVRVKEA